jgi:hypothetical protein
MAPRPSTKDRLGGRWVGAGAVLVVDHFNLARKTRCCQHHAHSRVGVYRMNARLMPPLQLAPLCCSTLPT